MTTLAQRIKQKYPGKYDEIPDAQLEEMIVKKYPGTYDHLPRTEEAKEPTFGQKLKRQAGLTTRAVVEGGLALPAMVADVPVTVARAFGYHTPKTSQEGISSLLTSAGVPQPETTLEKVAQFGAQAAVPAVLGGIAGKVKLGDIGKNTAESLMFSSLKPTIAQHKSGDAAVAAKTMLEKGVNVTEGGVTKMRGMIDDLNDEISNIIKNSKNVIDKKYVTKAVDDVMEKFRMQVNPQSDMKTIQDSLDAFLSHPDIKKRISVQLAQELKQGTYRILAKKYGQLGSADIEAQKALARGLKEGISAVEPAVAGLNAQESQLIKALDVAERRVLMDLNKNPGGLAWLTANPKTFMAFMADKSALFKSLLARAIYKTSEPLGAIAGGAGGVSLYGLNQLMKPTNPPQKIPLQSLGGMTPVEAPNVPEVQ